MVASFSRRAFALGFCSCFAARRQAHAEDNISLIPICSTIDTVDPTSPGLSIVPLGTSGIPVDFNPKVDGLTISPYGTAFLRDRWLRSDGLTPNTGKITLGVHFLNGSPALRERAAQAASQWTEGSPLAQRLAYRFDVSPQDSQIRVSFGKGGNWSYVGRQNLQYSKNEKTMNLENIEDFVICHEFGHAWCLQHEHQFPNAIKWNEAQVIADYKREQGWSESQIRSNILSKLGSDAICVGNPQFNAKSIMLYPTRPEWTNNTFSSDWNTQISDGDTRCLRGIYGV